MTRKLACAIAVLATASACGSTVSFAQRQAEITSVGAGASPGTALGGPSGSVAASVASGTGRTQSSGVSSAGPSATTSRTTGSATGPVVRSAELGPDIVIGVEYSSDYEQTMSALGFSGLASGDIPALVNTLVADLNAHGGLLGRRVRAIFHNTSTAQEQSDPSTALQAVCADFTQDHHVDFVVTPNANFTDCFVQAHLPVVQFAGVTPDGADRAFLGPRSPYRYAPTTFETDELYPLYLARLSAQGYFPPTAKVGLLSSNRPSEQRQAKYLLALLAKRNIAVAATFEYDSSNAASIESGVSSAVLRFQTAGVTNVISLDGNVSLFMIQAEQQQYRPRYAMNTFMAPTSVQLAVDPAPQLHGAVGVGWEPINDVAAPGDFRTPARTTCDIAVTRSGQNLAGKPTAEFVAYSVCDALQLLVQGAGHAQTLNAAAMRSALGRLGTSFPTALNLLGSYSPQMSAGAAAVRDLRYDDGCACFVYASKRLYR